MARSALLSACMLKSTILRDAPSLQKYVDEVREPLGHLVGYLIGWKLTVRKAPLLGRGNWLVGQRRRRVQPLLAPNSLGG